MTAPISDRQLTGLDDSHLVTLPSGHRLLGEVAEAYGALKRDAEIAGFTLCIASSFRSFSRQLTIWNRKACGERPVFDDSGCEICLADLQPAQQMHAILRFSAVPGSSRHHWGTDIDIYDAGVMPEDYQLQLSLQEVAPGGMFAELHCWLDERMAAGKSHGFYRPYAVDRGGVSPERWHLSYAPLSRECEQRLTQELLCSAWDCEEAGGGVMLRALLEENLPEIFERYIAVPPGWCG